jgi:hypothetical protein
MRSMLHIDAGDLTFTTEANNMHKATFDVLAMTFGDNGVPVDQSGRTYTLQLPETLYKRAMRDGLVYYLTVPVKKAGAYQMRISLRDSSSERIGSASQFIEVPDLKKNRLAVSGVVLSGANPSDKPAAPANKAAADDEGLEQGNPGASPAVRHFTRGMLMDYLFIIFNAHFDKGTNAPQLVTQVRMFRDGKPVFTGKENELKFSNITDQKRLITSGRIQLGTDLVPGEYVLQVIVKDLLADEKHRLVTQWMDFEIVK